MYRTDRKAHQPEFSLAFCTNGSTIGELEQMARQIAQEYGIEEPTSEQLTEIEDVILATINLARTISGRAGTASISREQRVQPGETIHHAVTLQKPVLNVTILDTASGLEAKLAEVSVKFRKKPNGGIHTKPLLKKIEVESNKFTTASSALPHAVLGHIQNQSESQ